MGFRKLYLFDILALVFTILSVSLQLFSFFYPEWWVYVDGSESTVVGGYKTTKCSRDKCEEKTLIEIEGLLEWLFISRIFLLFACALCIPALILHVIYLPVRKEGMRSVAIYLLGAAGLFCLGGSFVFAGLHPNLGNKLTPGTFSAKFPFGISILAGFLHIAASAFTAVATVRSARHVYDDEDIIV